MLYAMMVSRRERNASSNSLSRFGGFYKTVKTAKKALINSRFKDGYITSVQGGDIAFIKGFHGLGKVVNRG